MIAYIKGTVSYSDADGIIVENYGIGYQIKTPTRTAQHAQKGQEITLFTYLYVREDILALYGFATGEELKTFQILLGVNGIGPKAALSVLSTLDVEDLYYAVFSEDAKAIARAPGIGPKGAKRMIMELKDKLDPETLHPDLGAEEAVLPSAMTEGDSRSDAMDALIALGYSSGEAYRAVHKVAGAEEMDSEQLLKEALKAILTI